MCFSDPLDALVISVIVCYGLIGLCCGLPVFPFALSRGCLLVCDLCFFFPLCDSPRLGDDVGWLGDDVGSVICLVLF